MAQADPQLWYRAQRAMLEHKPNAERKVNEGEVADALARFEGTSGRTMFEYGAIPRAQREALEKSYRERYNGRTGSPEQIEQLYTASILAAVGK